MACDMHVCTCTCTHYSCGMQCTRAACCHLMCHVVEVVAICQISSAETRKLFLYLQNSKAHLVSGSLPSSSSSLFNSPSLFIFHPLQPSLPLHLPPSSTLPPSSSSSPLHPILLSLTLLFTLPSSPSRIPLHPPLFTLPSSPSPFHPPLFILPFSSLPPPFLLPPPLRLLQEKLPPLLYHISLASTSLTHTEPSTYVEFSYNRPSESLSSPEMLSVPFTMPWGDKPRCVSLWFCVNKYPLQAQVHLFTAFTGRLYFQIWVCACSGDVTIRWVCGMHIQVMSP